MNKKPSEIIREKALRFLDKEVPHGIAVGIINIDEIVYDNPEDMFS